MKKVGLVLLLGGLLLVGSGCGGGGSSSSGNPDSGDNSSSTVTINKYTQGNYTIGLYYTVTTSSGDYIKMTVTDIDIKPNKSFVVNCTWTATNITGSPEIVKVTDACYDTFYMVDNNNGGKYNHTGGTGAAYTTTALNPSAKGSYYFPALKSGATSFYLYDSVKSKRTGWIKFSNL